MAVTYPLQLPSSPAFVTSSFHCQRGTAISQSPFTGQMYSTSHALAVWKAVVSLPPMKREQAREWVAFIMKLRGRQGTFLMGDPDGKNPTGAINTSNTVQCNSAGSIGDDQLALKGLGASVTNVFRAGDYISYLYSSGGQTAYGYHMIVDSINSDGNGHAIANIEPFLHYPISENTTVTFVNPKAQWRLDSNEISWDTNRVSNYGISFSCTENWIAN